jgi:hypothetical protein
MAQVSKQHITVGGNRIVGQVSVDGGALRGEGGPSKPQLVVPLTVQMNNTPAGAMLALCWLRARLATDQHSSPQGAIAQPTTELLLDNLPARSFPEGQGEHVVHLRFYLHQRDIDNLERIRHQAPSDLFPLYLHLEAVVAGVRTYNSVDGSQVNTHDMPWGSNMGCSRKCSHFGEQASLPFRSPLSALLGFAMS